MVIKVKGILDFKVPDVSNKHKAQDWKKVAIIKTNCDLDNYYGWFLKKRFDINFVKNLRGAHVTIISDKIDSKTFEEAANLFDGKPITFYYEIEPRTNTKHWWLRVHCPEAEKIRETIGLNKDPYFGFHLTIGHISDRNIKHSEYIFNTIKRFNILCSEPKKLLSEHEIIEF